MKTPISDHDLSLPGFRRFEAELSHWDRIMYRDGGRSRSSGVDCLGFATAMLEFLHGRDPIPPFGTPLLPPQTAVNAAPQAWGVAKWLKRRYPCRRLREGEICRPGDLLICFLENDAPAHLGIAGTRPNTVWHALNQHAHARGGSVQMTGIGWFKIHGLRGRYRMLDASPFPEWRF